ncbi:DUF4142 domain-containing protein [Segetibacter sp. 3557_3]|uniref:DUF4142 domain-containing protein n=1 Tax=Segetibacter sp. 3557_3 TaxID=2547429 RepID=UPI0010589FCD|nr:DUF4142 domain-containing protein [Segetibacter sp. 3557_3]TDH21437.1 DUF4142 domain-containing protein [Segetibacter sp. 3557_3]
MMLKKMIYTGSVLAGLALVSCSKDDKDLNDTDRQFMVQASLSNTAEIGAGTMASTKATSPIVKAFAMSMVAEHTTAQNDLKNRGNSVGNPVRDTLDPAHVALALQLNSLSGRAFDSVYMHSQVADHIATITFFQNEQSNGQHRDILGYANTYRPHIEMHRSRADSIATNLFRR